MNTEQLAEWARQIPIEELWNEIRKLTRLADLKFSYEVVERNGYARILFESQDLVDQVGFLRLIFDEIRVTNFNSEVRARDGIPYFWGTANFSYHHPSGGSNGCGFLTFWYDDQKGWTFEQRG